MSAAIDITDSELATVLRAFLLNVCVAGTEVIRGQANRVPEPLSADFIVMTPAYRSRLSTNIDAWDTTLPTLTETGALQATRVDVQLDIHGPNSTDNAQIISTLFRDVYACDFFAGYPYDIQPLYSDDGKQMPFINGESQYEDRWVVNVIMQANPIVSTPQQFADTVTVGLIEIDATYPPS